MPHSGAEHFENWTKQFVCPTSSGASEWTSVQTRERSRAREQSEQCGASERASWWASAPLLTSLFQGVLNPCVPAHPSFCSKNSQAMIFFAEAGGFVQVNQIILCWLLVKFVLRSKRSSPLAAEWRKHARIFTESVIPSAKIHPAYSWYWVINQKYIQLISYLAKFKGPRKKILFPFIVISLLRKISYNEMNVQKFRAFFLTEFVKSGIHCVFFSLNMILEGMTCASVS